MNAYCVLGRLVQQQLQIQGIAPLPHPPPPPPRPPLLPLLQYQHPQLKLELQLQQLQGKSRVHHMVAKRFREWMRMMNAHADDLAVFRKGSGSAGLWPSRGICPDSLQTLSQTFVDGALLPRLVLST